jgi:hypothetical protein
MSEEKSEITPKTIVFALSYKLKLEIEVAGRDGIPPSRFTDVFIYQHADNIAALLFNVGALETVINAYAVRLLVRPMLESFFAIQAACNESSFATDKMAAELSDCVRRFERLKKYPLWTAGGNEINEALNNMISLRDNFFSDNKITTVPKFTVRDIACLAKAEEWYDTDYFFLSNHVHGAVGELCPLKQNTSRGFLLRTASYIGINTLHAFQNRFHLNTEDNNAKARDKYIGLMQQLENAKAYDSIQWEPVKPLNIVL